jgi:small neutral amino acid transporter SnatA (MarC family)
MNGTIVVSILVVWVGAIAILAYAERADKFLGISILIAVAGVFSSILPFAISRDAAVITNGVILILFIFSLKVLNPTHHQTRVAIRQRTR